MKSHLSDLAFLLLLIFMANCQSCNTLDSIDNRLKHIEAKYKDQKKEVSEFQK